MDPLDTDTTQRVGATEGSPAQALPPLAAGRTIGRYVVLEEVGRGAMGAVYAAFDPQLDRKLAIKLLHASAGGPEDGREELLHEAQAIAGISHPNVVAVHDVGVFEDRVFLAMELLDGGTLRGFVERTRPSWRVIVQCFVAAGRGLAAAHALGMIHRDFKPDNVFIGAPQPGAELGRVPTSIRVGDFGLARAIRKPISTGERTLGGSATTSPRATRHDSLAGSPAYMSPEQYDTQELDDRSDQYSFCVALFEMLHGYRPFRASSSLEVRDSKRAGKIAAVPPDTEVPRWLRRAIERGLSPARDDRHASMAALVRALDGEAAGVRRRWGLTIGAAAVLVTGAAITYAAAQGDHGCTGGEQKLAEVWHEDARQAVRSGLTASGDAVAIDVAARVEDVLGRYTEAWRAQHLEACAATRVRAEQPEAVLDRRMECLGDRLRDLHALLEIYRAGDRDVTVRALDAAYALPSVASCADPEAASAEPAASDQPAALALADRSAHARALLNTGGLQAALRETEDILREARAIDHAPTLADALLLRGRCEEQAGHFAAAQDAYREAMSVATAARGDEVAARAAIALVSSSARSGRPDEAATALRFAESAVGRMGEPRELAIALLDATGVLRYLQGDYEAASIAYRSALELETSVEQPQRDAVAHHWHSIANVAQARGELDAALEALTRVLDVRIELFGPSHPAVADVESQTSSVLRRQGRLAEAQAASERSLAIRTVVFGPDSAAVAESLNELATVLASRGRWDEAQATFERTRAVSAAALGETHPAVANALNNLAMCAHHRKDLDTASRYMDEAHRIWVATYGERHPLVATALGNMAELAHERGDVARAAELAGRAVEMFRAIDSGKSGYFPPVLALLGELERGQGHDAQAEAAYREVLGVAERTRGVDAETVKRAWCGLGRLGIAVADRPPVAGGDAIDCTAPG